MNQTDKPKPMVNLNLRKKKQSDSSHSEMGAQHYLQRAIAKKLNLNPMKIIDPNVIYKTYMG